MPILFLVIFAVMAGFAILLPSIMFVLQQMGAAQSVATPILASYSFTQFLIGPAWGSFSDRMGRRPLLILSLIGSTLSYGFLSLFATSPLAILAGLIMAGFFAGNTAIVLAAVTDVTSTENRAKGMGLIGAAIGLAFTLGPVLGAFLGGQGAENATITGPATASAIMCAIGALVVMVRFKETMHSEADVKSSAGRLEVLARLRSRPIVLQICVMMLCFTIPLSMMETIMSYFTNIKFGWGQREIGTMFFLIGLTLMLVQGGMIGRLTQKFGERALARFGVLMMGAGLFATVLAPYDILVYLSVMIVSMGVALFNTSMSALVSHRTSPSERGAVLGVFQSMQSLGRSAGPLAAGILNQQMNGLPILVGGFVIALVFLWMLYLYGQIDKTSPVEALGPAQG